MIRVLIADDEGIERMALCRRLQKHFGDTLAISQAEDGAEAVELFRKEKSQIVIMDIAMPVLNGVEAAEQIRGLDDGCVIIFLTAYDEFSYARRALVIRALDYLLKPCEEDELVAVMEEAIRLAELCAQGRPAGYFRSAKQESIPVLDEEDGGESRMTQVAASILDYIRRNYMKEISMQDAARAMNYSDAYFCKLFKQCFDQNFTTYLTHFRMGEAKKLLQNREMNVKDVSVLVGYPDSNYFSKVFKRITGMIPSEFRDSQLRQK
ncbi:MAG: response regulator [Enterocloster asparagiformis]|nr:response regulator [Enterocloster asparagiformis]